MEATVTAGAKLYKELTAQYRLMLEGAQRDMQTAACEYTEKGDDKQRCMYLQAKARYNAWDQAINALTRNAGDWMRLDFPKS